MAESSPRVGGSGFSPGTVLSQLTLVFPTGRWAILRFPDDLTAAECARLREHLRVVAEDALAEVEASARAIEQANPATARREAWPDTR